MREALPATLPVYDTLGEATVDLAESIASVGSERVIVLREVLTDGQSVSSTEAGTKT